MNRRRGTSSRCRKIKLVNYRIHDNIINEDDSSILNLKNKMKLKKISHIFREVLSPLMAYQTSKKSTQNLIILLHRLH
ncbi:unnamed protein product [Parnassius apollo]|uniref:(apollo) hypothetical protein n=1 Tax=Parnassius apollo TaxID=110799 RepID=A0A8S3X431_PARAO|nr:unnamed protein product [Parnassius apollo]